MNLTKLIIMIIIFTIIIGHGNNDPAFENEENQLSYTAEGSGSITLTVGSSQLTTPINDDTQATTINISEGDNFSISMESPLGDARIELLDFAAGGKLARWVIADNVGIFFNLNYKYIKENFGHKCTSQASTNQFTLDGYLTGSGFFAPGDISIFINDEEIYQATNPSTHLLNFDAEVGDRMRILVDNVDTNGILDVICLTTPSGHTVRLTHYAEISAGGTFDVTYEIREN